MHALKGFIIAIAGLFGLITAISLLMPSRVMLVRTTTVTSSPGQVYALMNHLDQWPLWHPALGGTSKNWKVKQGPGGFEQADWEEKGYLQTLRITGDSAMVLQCSLSGKNEKPLQYIIRVSPGREPGQTEVEWRVVQPLGWWPWDKFGGMVMDKMAGPGYEAALKSLKEYSEQQP